MFSAYRTVSMVIVTALYCAIPAAILQTIPGYRVTYPEGKVGGASSTGFPSYFVKINNPGKQYYVDYRIFFESDFEWVKGGKIPGLVGGSHTTGCNDIVPDGWSARFMWEAGGKGKVYLYHQNRKNDCGDDYPFSAGTFTRNQWNRITERVVINTPGRSDGIVEAWFNGKKVVTITNVELRGEVASDVALVDHVGLETFYGGSSLDWAPSDTTHAQFSIFYIRDDLPDFSIPFEDIKTASRKNSGPVAPAKRVQAAAVSRIEHGTIRIPREFSYAASIEIYTMRGQLICTVSPANPSGIDPGDFADRFAGCTVVILKAAR